MLTIDTITAPTTRVTSPAANMLAPALPIPYGFEALLTQFLHHLANSRRCSPRTAAAYASDCRKVIRALTEVGHSLDVREVTAGDLQVCLGMFPTLSASSLQRLAYAVRSFFSYLRRMEITVHDPTQHLDLPRREHRLPRAVAEADVQALLAACPTISEKTALVLLSHCGLRRAEMLGLTVQDVAGDLSSVRVNGKGRRQRVVPVHESLQQLLRAQIECLPNGSRWLICNQIGTQMSPTSFCRLFGRIVAAAGLQGRGMTPHSLRHHFARQLLKSGADLATIAELMGHASVATTSYHLRSDAQSKLEAISRLPTVPPSCPSHSMGEQSSIAARASSRSTRPEVLKLSAPAAMPASPTNAALDCPTARLPFGPLRDAGGAAPALEEVGGNV